MSTEAAEAYKKRQYESIHHTQMDPVIHDRLKAYALENQMSESEVIREAIGVYMGGDVPIGRRRRTRRVTYWAPPEDFIAFSRKAKDAGVTKINAIEAALGEIL